MCYQFIPDELPLVSDSHTNKTIQYPGLHTIQIAFPTFSWEVYIGNEYAFKPSFAFIRRGGCQATASIITSTRN